MVAGGANAIDHAVVLAAKARRVSIVDSTYRKPCRDLVVLVSLLTLGLLCWISGGAAYAQQNTQRVLLLYPYNNLFPASVITGEAAQKRLVERSHGALELYTDYLDLARFSGEAYESRTAQYLAEKYRDREPNLIIALGPQALRFAVKKGQELGFDAPVVFCCTSRATLAALNPPANVTGIISGFDLTKTMKLAQRLQPDARHIVVVAGAREFERISAESARRQLAPYGQQYDIKYLVGLRHEDLLQNLKQVPRDTIVILLTVFLDSTGRHFVTPEVVPEITKAAAAPAYSAYETYLGYGVVGGYSDSFERTGEEIADLSLDILAGARPASLVPRPAASSADRVDWRQLKRWNISESRVPAGAEVRFREYTLWELYRWQIIAIFSAVLLQAMMIAWLLFEHGRRRVAETRLRKRLLEVIHLNRTAIAGALSGSVAHELNQPLGAIQNYAEAASLYLKAEPPNLQRVEQILENIRRDDQRAADIISHFRGLLKKHDAIELQEFDLNEVVRNALDIIGPEAAKQGIEVKAHQASGRLSVRADRIQLQQVILNLVMNGLDAMQKCAPGDGKMSIHTLLAEKSAAEVLVADSGAGIPADKLSQIFDTFYTTKRQGTGLGLSIARIIVESYGGKIWAENRGGGGAVFRFTLPLSNVPAL